jgi:adenylate cyclase
VPIAQMTTGVDDAAVGVMPARPGVPESPRAEAVRRELDRVFASADFDATRRSREFLRFVVEEALANRGGDISQAAIAIQVFGRRNDFDGGIDPIVRIQAGRLRRSLERYYLLDGRRDPVRIDLPKGGYDPVFRHNWGADHPEARVGSRVPDDGWPSVALNEFEVAAPGGELDDMAVRLNEELALELGRYRTTHLFQRAGRTGPSHAARFELGGRLRRKGDDLSVAARLVDCATGEQIWGDEYQVASWGERRSGSADDVARVIAARVGAEEGVIVQYLAAERRKHPPAVPTPCDAFLRSYEFFLARDPDRFLPAVEALRQVVATRPDHGVAWSRLARLYVNNHTFEVTPVLTPLEEAVTCAHQGVRVDPASRSARCVLAIVLLTMGEITAAREELDQALRLSPGSLMYLEMIGNLLTLLGEWERGASLSRHARERNPHCLPHVSFGQWADHLRRGEPERAYQAALEYRDPTFFWRGVMRASCLGLLGRTAEARWEVADILGRKPNFPERGRVLLGYYLKFPETLDPVVDGLARAGLELA